MSIESTTTRRRFLEVVALGAAGAACSAIACSSSAGASPAAVGDVSAGNVSALPVNTLKAISGQPVAIGRDASGLYAMTLTCTHQGCNIGTRGSVSFAGLHCGCHGASFDANGEVTGGPAPTALQHFAVSVDATGEITIHGGTDVDASTRTPVTG